MASDGLGSARIIGGGIGGLTTAAALAKRGWSVTLYERESALRARGSGIYLWNNGLAVLADLGVLDQAIEGAHYGPRIETRNAADEVMASVETGRGRPVTVLTAARSRLIDALAGACREFGVDVQTGKEGVSARPDGSVSFADGTEATADLVVVADGVNSRIRDGLALTRSRVGLGQWGTRTLIPRRPGLLPDADEPKYIEWMAGQRFVLWTPISAESLYISLVAPTGHPSLAPRLDPTLWTDDFPQLGRLFAELEGHALHWAEFEHITLDRWSTGRVAVLGDAAHAQPPYLGQGGGCAMMNAVGLAHAVSVGAGSLQDRLRLWEETERPLIEFTQAFSTGVAQLNDLPESVRATFIGALGASPEFGRQRLRAATTTPTGIAPFRSVAPDRAAGDETAWGLGPSAGSPLPRQLR